MEHLNHTKIIFAVCRFCLKQNNAFLSHVNELFSTVNCVVVAVGVVGLVDL